MNGITMQNKNSCFMKELSWKMLHNNTINASINHVSKDAEATRCEKTVYMSDKTIVFVTMI